jgi:hypothetical protein
MSTPSATAAQAAPIVAKKQLTLTDKLIYFAKKYYVQLAVLTAILLIVYCKKSDCANPVCQKLPSFLQVCNNRPLPGGVNAPSFEGVLPAPN